MDQKISGIFRNQKVELFDFEKCPPKNFQKKSSKFFELEKNVIFFSELKKKLGYNFDAEIRDLSIYGVFRVIPALIHMFWDSLL